MKEAATRGASEIFLEVRADNPGAQALYCSFGFEEIAVRPRYYQPDDVDAIVMRAVELRASRGDAAEDQA
jgi:ribosomal protein S18 acetylase RimI-like enzyme